MSEPAAGQADVLRYATADAWRAVERVRAHVRDELGDSVLLAVLGDRIAALLGEFAWEIGMIDPAVASEGLPGGARLDHIGIVVADLRAAALLYGEVLGGTLVAGGVEPGLGVRSLHYEYGGGSKIELLQPLSTGPVADFLETRGGGMHHLTFFVPELQEAIDELDRNRFVVVDASLDSTDWQEAYVSPRSAQGCLLQLVASPESRTLGSCITLDEVLADKWEWVEHRPHRIRHAVKE